MIAKTVLLAAISLLFLNCINGQSFAFKIFFEDAQGNRDTIELGLDPQATVGIDELFGEENIMEVPYRNGIDVRITDGWLQETTGSTTSYHTKKQLVNMIGHIQDIIIRTDHFPVTASWDSTLLASEDSIAGSFMTSFYPSLWFDVPGSSDMGIVTLSKQSSVTFTSNLEGEYEERYGYIYRDTMPVYWFTFASAVLDHTNEIILPEQFSIYPNPASDIVRLKNESRKKIKHLSLINIHGQVVHFSFEEKMDLGDHTPGIYWLKIITEEGDIILKKLIKH